jgi:hypothetical protein
VLPYSAEALFALHGRILEQLWAAALPLALLALLAAPTLVFIRRGWAPRAAWAVVAGGWLWVGAVFHLQHFAAFNFMAPLFGWAFLLQGLLLGWWGVVRGRAVGGWPGGWRGWLAGLAVAFALVGYPVVDLLTGPGDGVRLAGLAPGPTALLSLGLLAGARGRGRLLLSVIPLLSVAAAGFQGWVLGLPSDLAAVPLGLLAAAGSRMGRTRADDSAPLKGEGRASPPPGSNRDGPRTD